MPTLAGSLASAPSCWVRLSHTHGEGGVHEAMQGGGAECHVLEVLCRPGSQRAGGGCAASSPGLAAGGTVCCEAHAGGMSVSFCYSTRRVVSFLFSICVSVRSLLTQPEHQLGELAGCLGGDLTHGDGLSNHTPRQAQCWGSA